MFPLSLTLLTAWLFTTASGSPQTPAAPFPFLIGNTSVLPPGWSGNSQCLATFSDCTFNDLPLEREFLSGPAFTDPVHMTIELCVAFCDGQGSRMAGLKGTECRCPGNRRESCGLSDGTPPLFNIFFNEVTQFSCSNFLWPGGASLTAVGSWRFSYFYNDSPTAHALTVNMPALHGNLTSVGCVTECGNSGFTLAGLTGGDECYCGNSIQNSAHPITDCTALGFGSQKMIPCTGNSNEFCGGPNIMSIYTLPVLIVLEAHENGTNNTGD
ncbi:WSC domain-containing protein [Psilocybe cubensis]|uniref:WSC domain-containing protein n=1 Tax=Psilocybe cubensis TaxID=181762 RepID=A0ACB8HDW8_PSICU|nr:WSC domain-containing protein [Psilocybe cubensis]KAH9486024.1 WSC domain-containing protein [Psilocybe cubensis]